MTVHTFKAGQLLKMSDRTLRDTTMMEILVSIMGEGPYQAVEVENVPPRKCDCGKHQGMHHSNCSLTKPDSVGHHQIVILIDQNQIPHKYSGAYFQPA